MKNRIVFLMCLMMAAFLCACSANIENDIQSTEPTKTVEYEVEEQATQLSFGSVEEFVKAIKTTESDVNDSANLAALTEFAMPTGIPDAYQLYKVTVSNITIGFWYLPEEYLADEDSILEGELNQKHFLFIYPRTEEKFETVVGQLHGMSGEMVSNKYFASSTQVVWDECGKPYMMYLPVDAVGANTASATSVQRAMATTAENLPILCATETITIE